jgi:hypothetical protein
MRHIESLEGRSLLTAVTLAIDSTLSSMTVDLSFSSALFGSASFVPQSSGSNVAKFQGTVKADVTTSSLKLTGGSAIDLIAKSGTFQPGGTNADLAGKATVNVPLVGAVTAYATARDVLCDLVSSSAIPVSSSTGSFSSSAITGKLTKGRIDYSGYGVTGSYSLVNAGSLLAGSPAGTLKYASGAWTLTLPIDIRASKSISVSGFSGTGNIHVYGKLVAKSAPVATGSIKGIAFADDNGDGIRQASELLQAGWTMYVDADNDSVFDSTEKSAVTDATGTYTFSGLSAGTHRVREVVKSGYRMTSPTTGYHLVTLSTSSSAITGKNFGNTRRTRVGGVVFRDLDKDGLRDTGDYGLAGLRVYIDANNNGKWDSTERYVLTGNDGTWAIDGLTSGTYRFRVVVPSGNRVTAPTTGYWLVTVPAATVVGSKSFGVAKS